MKTTSHKPLVIFFKILLLIVSLFVGFMFINSCSMINTHMTIPQTRLINNSFISQDDEYILHFNESEGSLKSQSTDKIINFEYKYESGIALCNYYESYINEENEVVTEIKEITFLFVEETILYCQKYHMLFGLI